MKTLVFGDIHGRTVWKDIVESEHPDRVIFLGDYFSSHENISEEDQIQNYKDILEYKKSSGIEVIMLRGNHDMDACGYVWAECYPAFYNNFLYGTENRKEFLDNTQWVFVQDDIIFSHAGISENWYQKLHVNSISDINSLKPSELFGFCAGPDNPFDGHGDSIYQPCTWIRPHALISSAVMGTHVIGHTGVFETVTCLADRIKVEDDEDIKNLNIWCCDALAYEAYLVIEDNEFKPKTYVR